jgi:two-component system response regulator DegU
MDKVIKLAVVEDDDFYRANIAGHLQSYKDLKIIINVSNGKQLIHTLEEKEEKPNVILMDYEMPVMDGTATTQYLSANYPDIKILILTVHNDEGISNHLIKNGANGFLLKENGLDKVVDAIRIVHKHTYYFSGWDLKKIIATKKIKTVSQTKITFSEREIDVIRLMFEGYTNKEISTKLFLSTRTIETHKERLFQKTNSRNIAQFTFYLVQHNLIDITNGKR